jgi:diketogulonate reductase-like aldo/keto reductase
VRAIGVSYFNINRLTKVNIVPAVNQIEAHPYLQQLELTEYCKREGILVQAYSPLENNQTGEPRTVDDAVVHVVAKEVGLDPRLCLVSWAISAVLCHCRRV